MKLSSLKMSLHCNNLVSEKRQTSLHITLFFPQLLLPIVGLCGIDGVGYPQSDLVILTSLLKNAKLPAHVSVPGMYLLIYTYYKRKSQDVVINDDIML